MSRLGCVQQALHYCGRRTSEDHKAEPVRRRCVIGDAMLAELLHRPFAVVRLPWMRLSGFWSAIGVTLDSIPVRVLKVVIDRRFVACTHMQRRIPAAPNFFLDAPA